MYAVNMAVLGIKQRQRVRNERRDQNSFKKSLRAFSYSLVFCAIAVIVFCFALFWLARGSYEGGKRLYVRIVRNGCGWFAGGVLVGKKK